MRIERVVVVVVVDRARRGLTMFRFHSENQTS